MYRALVMFPTSAPAVEVDALIDGIASSFRSQVDGVSVIRSAGALMVADT
jgi:hypothetical protein